MAKLAFSPLFVIPAPGRTSKVQSQSRALFITSSTTYCTILGALLLFFLKEKCIYAFKGELSQKEAVTSFIPIKRRIHLFVVLLLGICASALTVDYQRRLKHEQKVMVDGGKMRIVIKLAKCRCQKDVSSWHGCKPQHGRG